MGNGARLGEYTQKNVNVNDAPRLKYVLVQHHFKGNNMRTVALFLICYALIVFAYAEYWDLQNTECNDKGGLVIKQAMGYSCLQDERK